VSTLISQQIQDLQAQIAEAAEKIALLEDKLRAIDGELASHLNRRAQYQLLEEICTPLEKLCKTDAANLFREAIGNDPERQLQQMRRVVAAFQREISLIEQSRGVLQADIKDKQSALHILGEKLAARQAKAERLKNDPQHDMPYRVLPWSHHGGDERRFRRILFTTVLFVIGFGGLIPFFKQPVEESKGVVVPERIARIIKKKQEALLEKQRPTEKTAEKSAEEKIAEEKAKKAAEIAAEKAPEKIAEKAPEKKPEKIAEEAHEKTADKTPSSNTSKPIEPEAPSRKSVETKGVLALKSELANLLKDTSTSKMGTDARISINAKRTSGDALQRSIIVSKDIGESGGINTATINRQVEGSGGGQRIAEADIKFTHVESVASSGSSGADRPLSKGAGARTDEEIQIVFDRYKQAIYRLYNRELRVNPTLRGKMVLRIVIEPDGHVSSCTVKSTDLASPALSADIVDRVLKFDFGAKAGAPALTILYPIDFLPAN
jgi:hypothetical protein